MPSSPVDLSPIIAAVYYCSVGLGASVGFVGGCIFWYSVFRD